MSIVIYWSSLVRIVGLARACERLDTTLGVLSDLRAWGV